MNRINKTLACQVRSLPVAVIVTVILLTASAIQSQAQTFNLSTGDTSLQINVGGPNPGLSNWTIGGVNQLEQEWFYYSVGGGVVNSIDTIAPWSTPSTIGGSNPLLTEMYSNTTLSVTTTYTLQSLNFAAAQLGTAISLQNLSGTNETLHFYQYSHFGLGGVSGGQNVQVFPSGSTTLYQFPTSSGGYLEETVDTGLGTTVTEGAGIFDGTQLGLENGNPAPNFTGISGIVGPGNVNFAYEFTATLAPNASITLSTIQAVPEPSSLALISLGMLALSLFSGRGLIFKFDRIMKSQPKIHNIKN